MKTARLTLDIPHSLKDTIKLLAVGNNTSIKDYIVEAIIEKAKDDEALENMIWGAIAKKEDQDNNYISADKSEDLLTKMLHG